jgi:hypothetical protein
LKNHIDWPKISLGESRQAESAGIFHGPIRQCTRWGARHRGARPRVSLAAPLRLMQRRK